MQVISHHTKNKAPNAIICFSKRGFFIVQSFFIELLNQDMKVPALYGSLKQSWFHYIALLLMTIGMILAIKYMVQASDKKLRRFFLISAIILLLFEIYKQWIFTYQNGSYPWYIFPFQFCSTPMYILLFAGITNHEKVSRALQSFLATFGLFAGLAVMLYPSTVFVSTVGINIQTMVHHGAMAIIGVGISVRLLQKKSMNMILAMMVFSVLVGMAILLNSIYNTWINLGTFNMFFINHLYDNDIPVLSLFQPHVPHFVFVLIYIIGFSLVATMMMILTKISFQIYIYQKTKERPSISLQKKGTVTK